MNDDSSGLSVKDYATSFLACYVIDSFGKLDIRWNRDPQFAVLYDLLFSVHDHKQQRTIIFHADTERYMLILFVLLGIALDTIRWQVTEEGKIVVTELTIPDKILLLDDEGHQRSVHIGGMDYLKRYKEVRLIPLPKHRKYLDEYYGNDPLKEITQIYNVLNNTLWRLANE